MMEDTATLPVTVTLTPPLLTAVEPAAASVRRSIEAELSELLRDLGLLTQPVVQLKASGPKVATDLVGVIVGGRPCRFPQTTIAEALAYVDGTPQVATNGDAVLDHLQGPGWGERVAELLASVCRAAVSTQPGILLTSTEDAGLRAAIDLGMSIAGSDAAVQHLAHDSGDPVERLLAALAAKTIDVHIDPAYLRILTAEHPGDELFRFLREGLFSELGLPLPPFHFRPDPSLRPAGFAFRINAVRILPRIGLSAGTILVNDTPERLALLNVDAQPTLNPATYQPGALVAEEHKEPLEAAGLTTWDPFEFLILSLAAAVRRSAHALMTQDVAARMVQVLGHAFPVLEDVARNYAPPDVLAPVLRELVLNAVPICNLRRILELLLRYETVGAADHGPDRMAFVRWGLADVIASKAARGTATLVTYLLDPEIESAVANRLDGTAPTGPEDPLSERLSHAVQAELSYLPPTAQVPALLTRDELRRPLSDLLRHEFPRMMVLAYGDLPPDHNVQPVARISWA
jgi:type III secretory pathway component EscV